MNRKEKRLASLSGTRPGGEPNPLVEKDLDPDIQKAIELHQSIEHNLRNAVKSAILLGELLLRKKGCLPHGEFTPWIENHLPFHPRTAQRYIKLAEHKHKLTASGLTLLEDAYKMIAEKKSVPMASGRLLYQRWKMGGILESEEKSQVKEYIEFLYGKQIQKVQKLKDELDLL